MSDEAPPPALHLAWCTYPAARYAVMRWHYSKAMPAGRLVRVGVWEHGRFVGCVLFGLGAGIAMAQAYKRDLGMRPTQFCELVRIALGEHTATVSRIVAIALRMLRQACPDLALVVSFADPAEGHHGGVYQAGGWVYTGRSSATSRLTILGRQVHDRSAGAIFGSTSEDWIRANVDPDVTREHFPGKHRYFFPLTRDAAERVERLRLPYPKPGAPLTRTTSTRDRTRHAATSDEDAGRPPAQDGSAPISPLQSPTP